MEQIVKTLIKRAISALVCIMMVAATFPVHMLNSAVFATNDELNLTLPKDMNRLKSLTGDDLKKGTINISFDQDWTPGNETFKLDVSDLQSGGLGAGVCFVSPDGRQFVLEDAEIDGNKVQFLALKGGGDAESGEKSPKEYKIMGIAPVNLKFPSGLNVTADLRGLFMDSTSSVNLKATFPHGETWGMNVGKNNYEVVSPDSSAWTSTDNGQSWISSDGKKWTSKDPEASPASGGLPAPKGSKASPAPKAPSKDQSYILSDGTVLISDGGNFWTPDGKQWTKDTTDGNIVVFTSPTGEKWQMQESAVWGCSISYSGKILYMYPAVTLVAEGGKDKRAIPDYNIDVWLQYIGIMPLMNAVTDLDFSFSVDTADLVMSKDYLFDFSDPKFSGKTINFKSSDGKIKKINMPNADIGFLKADGCKVDFENIALDGKQDYTDYVYKNPQDLKNPLTKDLISINNCDLNLGKGTSIENFVGLFACAIGSENSNLTMTGGAKICNCSSYGVFDPSKTGLVGGQPPLTELAPDGKPVPATDAPVDAPGEPVGAPVIVPGTEPVPVTVPVPAGETTCGGAIRLLNGSKLVLNGCLLDKCSCYSNRKACGGAIYSSGSVIEFLEGTISNSRTISGANDPNGCSYGGGIYAQGSQLNFKNGQISRCRAIEAEGINARRKGDAICLAFDCKYTFDNGFRIALHEDDENDLHNLDEKITGRCGVYVFGLEDEPESYYEVPIEGQEPIYIHMNQLENPLLEVLKCKLVRSEDGATFSEVRTEDEIPITQDTKLKDILLGDGSSITKKLIPTFDETQMHVSTYSMLQKAIYGAKSDRRIILDSDIFVDENCQPASDVDSFNNAKDGYCFSDNSEYKKNITLESADVDDPKMIKIKNSDLGLFAMQNVTLTLKNIKLDGGNFNAVAEQGDFINISQRSILKLEEGAFVQNVCKKDARVIFLKGGVLTINGAYITNCSINNDREAACGGAIYSEGGKIKMTGGGIVDCFAVTKRQNGSVWGGAICAIGNSLLEISGGAIEGCYVKGDSGVTSVGAYGDAIYFDGAEKNYIVAAPNGNLKIDIPADFVAMGHNSSPKIVGYQGIYTTNVAQIIDDEDDDECGYYEIKLDVDGGVNENNASPSCVYIAVGDGQSCLRDWLPNDLKKGEASIIQWTYEVSDGQVAVLDEETVSEMVKKLGKNSLKATYYAEEEHVKTASDLQKAIYEAKGNKVIILEEDIEITDDLADAAQNSDLENSEKSAASGYYLSDDKSLEEKTIVIKSEDQSAPKTISLLKAGSGLIALQKGSLTLENVIIDGLGAESAEEGKKIEGTADYIEIQKDSTLILSQGSFIKDVYRKNAKVICLNGGILIIDGGYITNCSVNYDDVDAYGGAVYADDGTVKMYSGGITNCYASTKKAKGGAFGGGICAIKGSLLELEGGIITGCDIKGDPDAPEVVSRGNAIYFEGNHPSYKVAKPGGKLKINIPAGYNNTPYNLDARIVGYQGIYIKNIKDGEIDDGSGDFAYYEILIDVDGGVDENGYYCGNAIYVDKNVKDRRILQYLPVYLQKGELILSGWRQDGCPVTKFARINEFLQEDSPNKTRVIKATYSYRSDEVHVSDYSDLQKALYTARGTRTIILDSDIEIADSFQGIDQSVYPSAASGYCFSDDSGVSNKIVTIKSADGNKFTITSKKNDYGLFAIRGGSIKFENVVLDGNCSTESQNTPLSGAGLSQDVNFIDVSKGATLELGKETEIKNVNGRSAIGLVGSGLNILDGCVIRDCFGLNGGAINASSGSEVNMLGGNLTDCRAENGGAMYIIDSDLNIQKGEIAVCSATQKGDAVYFAGEGKCDIVAPNGGLKITIPLDDNSHNSCGKIFGYWGIYKEGIGECQDHLNDERYYELAINPNGGVDKYGNFKINPVYISNEKPMSEIAILEYLPTDLTKHGSGVIKWVHCINDIDVTAQTKMKYTDLEFCDVIFNRVKAIYDDFNFDDAFGGCLATGEVIYGDEYDLSAISKNGVDGVKYEIEDGDGVARIDGNKLKILGAGTFKLKATAQAATYTMAIEVKPKDLFIRGMKPNDKEFDKKIKTTYTLEADTTGKKYETLKDAYDYILNRDKELYTDQTDADRALNVLKTLGLDLVSAQDADILSRYLDKIVFAFDDPEIGQNKRVNVRVVDFEPEPAPAEFSYLINKKYQLKLATECWANINEKDAETDTETDKDKEEDKDKEADAEKEINVLVRLNNVAENLGVLAFSELKEKDLNAIDKFRWFIKDQCEVEIIPEDNSCAISKVLHFRSPKSYLNICDLEQEAQWIEDGDGNSDGVIYNTSFAADGKISRVLLNISRRQNSEKFFLYLKIVCKNGKVKYLRSDGIILYNESKLIVNKYQYLSNCCKHLKAQVELNENKLYVIKNVNKTAIFSAERGFLKADYDAKILKVFGSVFFNIPVGEHVYRVSYIPSCCEKTEIENLDLLPFFDFNVEII